MANLDGNQANSKNCCSGQYSTPATCPPSGVAYYSYFKNACPRSYVYAYDESSGTALWTCPTSKKADCKFPFLIILFGILLTWLDSRHPHFLPLSDFVR